MLAQFPSAHEEVVTSLTFSPHITVNPYTLCSTSGDDTAALWDCRSGASISRLAHHRGPVNHSLFLPHDPNLLLTCADDRSIALWDLRRPESVVGTITGFQDGVNKLLLLSGAASGFPNSGGSSSLPGSDLLVASACDDGRVLIHSLVLSGDVAAPPAGFGQAAPAVPSVGVLVDSFWVSTSTVNDLVLAPNRRILLTASEDCAIRSWHLLFDPSASTDDRLIGNMEEFENPVNHIALVPPELMEAAQNGAAAPLQQGGGSVGEESDSAAAESEVVSRAYGGHAEEPIADDTRCWLVAGCSEFTFSFDMCGQTGRFGTAARSYAGHTDYVRGLEFTPTGTLLTVSDDSTCMEWTVATGEPIRQVKLHDGYVMASALTAAGDVLATGSDRGEIRAWRIPFETERMGS